MANYRLSKSAKQDLIRIHQFGVEKFGVVQADKYFETFFDYFDIIADRPFTFESVVYINQDTEGAFVAQIVFTTKFITEQMML